MPIFRTNLGDKILVPVYKLCFCRSCLCLGQKGGEGREEREGERTPEEKSAMPRLMYTVKEKLENIIRMRIRTKTKSNGNGKIPLLRNLLWDTNQHQEETHQS